MPVIKARNIKEAKEKAKKRGYKVSTIKLRKLQSKVQQEGFKQYHVWKK